MSDLITTRQILLFAAIFISLHRTLAAADATSVEVFVDKEKTSRRESPLTVPAGTDTLRFLVKPKSLFARYKLEGLDEDWSQQVDTIFLRVVFFNHKGDPIQMDPFPASGRSAGWEGTIQDSAFTPRVEQLTVPPGAASMSLIMTTAGPASLVGIFAIREASVTSMMKPGVVSKVLMSDIGTRVSHISLVASHADNTIRNEEAHKAFGQITSMSRDLIGALSETVWMLNSKNDDLESLVDFLYRLVQELCRLKKIRCRVDAVFITKNQPISYEFRHNVSLVVKESVNNVLKHSQATELDMKIGLENNVLMVTITDNGVGLTEACHGTGHGLENLQRRMRSITSNSNDIIEAIRDVFAGESPFSGPIARKMAMYFREEREIEDEREALSPRETEVLKLLAAGYIHKEVADELGITLPTVRTYVKRICFKLHVRSKVEAIIKYLS